MEALLRFDNVSKQYPNGVHALNGVSFTVGEGEFISVIGPSGSGKSTLLRAINRLIPISGGTVLLEGEAVSRQRGRALRALRRKVGMIFQNYNLVYSLSVLQNVLHGRLGYMRGLKGIFGLYSEADKRQALELLEELGLGEFSYNRASDLSGGQKQRVAIARAIMQGPKLLLCDEPIASLDPSSSKTIMDLLRSMTQKRNIACIVNLHQLDVALQYSTPVSYTHLVHALPFEAAALPTAHPRGDDELEIRLVLDILLRSPKSRTHKELSRTLFRWKTIKACWESEKSWARANSKPSQGERATSASSSPLWTAAEACR